MAFCKDKTALSLQFGKIALHFPKLQGETGQLRTASTATIRLIVSPQNPARFSPPKFHLNR